MNVLARFALYFLLSFTFSTVFAAITVDKIKSSLVDVQGNIETYKNKSNIEETLRLRVLKAYYATEDDLDELLLIEQQIQEQQKQLKLLPAEIKQLEKQISKTEIDYKSKKKRRFYNGSDRPIGTNFGD